MVLGSRANAGPRSFLSSRPLTTWRLTFSVPPKTDAMVNSSRCRAAPHSTGLWDRSSDAKSPTGPRWASLSGLTTELMLLI